MPIRQSISTRCRTGRSRTEVIDELHAAVFGGAPPCIAANGVVRALEVCRAIVQSAEENREIALEHQVTPEGLGA